MQSQLMTRCGNPHRELRFVVVCPHRLENSTVAIGIQTSIVARRQRSYSALLLSCCNQGFECRRVKGASQIGLAPIRLQVVERMYF